MSNIDNVLRDTRTTTLVNQIKDTIVTGKGHELPATKLLNQLLVNVIVSQNDVIDELANNLVNSQNKPIVEKYMKLLGIQRALNSQMPELVERIRRAQTQQVDIRETLSEYKESQYKNEIARLREELDLGEKIKDGKIRKWTETATTELKRDFIKVLKQDLIAKTVESLTSNVLKKLESEIKNTPVQQVDSDEILKHIDKRLARIKRDLVEEINKVDVTEVVGEETNEEIVSDFFDRIETVVESKVNRETERVIVEIKSLVGDTRIDYEMIASQEQVEKLTRAVGKVLRGVGDMRETLDCRFDSLERLLSGAELVDEIVNKDREIEELRLKVNSLEETINNSRQTEKVKRGEVKPAERTLKVSNDELIRLHTEERMGAAKLARMTGMSNSGMVEKLKRLECYKQYK